MPWTVINEIRKYKTSIYAKEELPTWDELYNGWYKQVYMKRSEGLKIIDTEFDPYWKILRKTFLNIIACNQFNKMIYEDGYKKDIIDIMNKYVGPNVGDICCFAHGFDYTEMYSKFYSYPLFIYTIPNPNGTVNPFIIDRGVERINVKETTIVDPYFICTMRKPMMRQNKEFFYVYQSNYIFDEIINYLFKDVIEYFENGIGWKDSEGNLLEKRSEKHTFDPAL